MTDWFKDAARASEFEETAADEPSAATADGANGDVALPPPEGAPAVERESSRMDLSTVARGELIQPGAAERVQASWGIRGLLVRLGIKMHPGKREQAHLDAERVIRQATWPRAVNVLISNKDGHVGKTTASLLLGGTLARVRGGSTCIFEVTDDSGALEKRAEGSPSRGLGELLEVMEGVRSAGELAGYSAPQTSHAHVIGTVGDRRELTGDDVHSLRTLLDRHHAITVADSGNNRKSSAFCAAVDGADVLVVPVLPTSVAVIDALSILESVHARGAHGQRLAESAVVIVNHDGRPEDAADVRRAREQLAQLVEQIPTIEVMETPYDAHVGKGGEITAGSLTIQSTVAWTKAAAEVTRRLLENVTDDSDRARSMENVE